MANYQIDPKQIKSMVNEFNLSITSHGYGKDYSLTIKNDILYLRTANRLEAFPLADEEIIDGILKYGIPTSWEENGPRFRGFKSAGEKVPPYLFDVVPLPKKTSSTGVGERFIGRKAKSHSNDTQLDKIIHDIYIQNLHYNELGKALSHTDNLRQSLLKYFKTEDAQELVTYLKLLGYESADIEWVEVGFLPPEAIFGVSRTKDGEIFITTAWDSYNKRAKEARFFGVNIEDLTNSDLGEEIIHIWRKDFDKRGDIIKIEEEAKGIERDHYLRLAKGADGDYKKRRKYEKHAAIKELDRLTTKERYQRIFTSKEENLEAKIEGSTEFSINGNVIYVPKEYFTQNKGSKYKKDKAKKSYEKQIDESEHKSMKDVTERVAKSKNAEPDRENSDNPEKSSDSQEPTEGEAQEAPTEAA